jgi:FkbM family methyltransferase
MPRKTYSKHLLERLESLFVGRKFAQPFWEKLNALSLSGMNIGGSSALTENGEQWVLENFRESMDDGRAPVIFDVGANVGDYSAEVLALMPTAQIYCFEPSPAAFERLHTRLATHQNLALFNVGLGEKDESVTLYSDTPASGMASVYHRRLDHFELNLSHTENIRLVSLDQFCASHGIEHIDLLKLDVEGHEFQVLKGGHALLRANAIDLIQFEFGGTDIDSRTFLQDFFYLLHPDYQICRVLRDGVAPLENYQERLEVFAYTNYVAISKKLSEHWTRLSARDQVDLKRQSKRADA